MSTLDRFAHSLGPEDRPALAEVRAYADWQSGRQGAEFEPTADDDVALRTYLLERRHAGLERPALQRAVAALQRFYAWAHAAGLIADDPFEDFNFDRPILSRDQIRRRQDAAFADPHEREIARLRALNHLAAHLNASLDVQTTLDVALQTLVEVMGLHTAWAFLLTGSGLADRGTEAPPHDFADAAACGLPPGLEQDGRRYLRQPPDCHCQALLRSGRLTRAVNVVECTRLQDAAAAQGDNRGLFFHASVPVIAQGRPLGILNYATEEWQFLTAADLHLLSAVGAQVGTALERAHLYEITRAQNARLEGELEMARTVQASLLPLALPDIPGFGLAADWRSAREVAGDFYDVFRLPDGRWALVVADVSDKGAAAALYMAMARSLIRSQAEHAPGPRALLADVNRALCRQTSLDMFVTVFYATLDPRTRTLTYALAGHNPPVIRRAGQGAETLPLGSLVLGIWPEAEYVDRETTLAPGDALVAYTDGVTEAVNPHLEEYGAARLLTVVGEGPRAAQPLLQHILSDLAEFTDTAPQPDDITLLVLACT